MAKGSPRSRQRGNPLQQEIMKLDIPVNAPITVDGASGVGFGSIAFGLPEGNVLFLGCVANLSFSGSGSDAGLVDTWNGDFGIGTTPASDGTITAGDVDIVPSTALGPAVAEASPITRATHVSTQTGVVFDNTAGDLELNLNLLVDDADISADGVPITAEGLISVAFIMLGDD